MKNGNITLEKKGDIALITLRRLSAMNAVNAEMLNGWDRAYRDCDNDDTIRAIVVTGEGKYFCTGADMSDGESTFKKMRSGDFSSCPILPAWKVRKPVIAAMNGHAIGLGFSLALQCDFRFGSNAGKYAFLQTIRGLLGNGCIH